MDRALDSDEPPGDGSHIGGELPYILAGLGAVWLVSMGLMAANSLVFYCNSPCSSKLTIDKLSGFQKTAYGGPKGHRKVASSPRWHSDFGNS
jgi:hypothetical protein